MIELGSILRAEYDDKTMKPTVSHVTQNSEMEVIYLRTIDLDNESRRLGIEPPLIEGCIGSVT